MFDEEGNLSCLATAIHSLKEDKRSSFWRCVAAAGIGYHDGTKTNDKNESREP